MSTCIVKGHSAGLGSLINNALPWMEIYQHVYVDWSSCLYGPRTFESLFEPLVPPSEPYDVVGPHPSYWLTGVKAAQLYQSGKDWRTRCNALWSRWNVLSEIQRSVNDFVRQEFKGRRVVSVQVRASFHAQEQVNLRSQSLTDYAKLIESNLGDGSVYVASSDEQSLSWFKERFPVISHPRTRRSVTRDSDFHTDVPQTVTDAVNCLEEVLIMSRSDLLIHSVSNMATISLYANPSLSNIFLP